LVVGVAGPSCAGPPEPSAPTSEKAPTVDTSRSRTGAMDSSGHVGSTKDAGAKEEDVTANSRSEARPSFSDDLAFLNAHGKVLVLSDPDGAKVALSAQYQGRVMTSAVSSSGRSLGWINRTFIEAGKTSTQFDNFGGEDRFWLGPEGGQYGLYFPKGSPFTFDAWQTPHP